MTPCGTLSFGSNMVNDFSFGALSHWRRVCGSQIKKKRQAEPIPNDSQLETLSVVPIWLMTLPSEHCYTGGMFMVNK